MLGVITLAVMTRSIHVNSSFWLDEAAQAIESARPFTEQFQIVPDFQPPLYHVIVHFWMSFGGKAEWWLRLTSIIPGLITIWITMLLAKKWFNQHTALITGILLASSQFHTFYSQELRPYSLAACFALLAVYSFSYLDTKPKIALAGLMFSWIMGCYTTYVFPLIPITLWLVTVFWYQRNSKYLLLATIVTIVAWIPWIPTFVAQLQTGTGLAADSTVWSQIVSYPWYKSVPLTFFKFLIGRIPFSASIPNMMMYTIMGIIAIRGIIVPKHYPAWKIVGMLIGVPILISFMLSFFVPILDPKRVLYSLPFLYMLIAASIPDKPKGAFILVFLLMINMSGLAQYGQNPDVQREPWRDAISTITREIHQSDQVVFAFPQAFAPWLWYADSTIPTMTMPIAQPLIENRYIVFDYLMDMTDPHRQIYAALQDSGYYEASFLQYPGIGKIRFFSKASPVARRLP